jgi:hypothetical protein
VEINVLGIDDDPSLRLQCANFIEQMPCHIPEFDQHGIVLLFPETGAKASRPDLDPQLRHQVQILPLLRGSDKVCWLIEDVERDLIVFGKNPENVGQSKIAGATVKFSETDMYH